MNIVAFDKNFTKIALVERYSFADYTRKYCNTGQFSIKLHNDEGNKRILDNYKYILFGTSVLGVRGKKSNESTDEWTIEGTLAQSILASRVFEVTANFSGTPANIVKSMVTSRFISPTNIKRKISLIQLDSNDVPGTSINMQVTGDEVEIAIINLLEQYDMGYDLYTNKAFNKGDRTEKIKAIKNPNIDSKILDAAIKDDDLVYDAAQNRHVS